MACVHDSGHSFEEMWFLKNKPKSAHSHVACLRGSSQTNHLEIVSEKSENEPINMHIACMIQDAHFEEDFSITCQNEAINMLLA